jgi:hypothetical protein
MIIGLWGIQKYGSTDVQGVQENVAIEDGGSWFTVKRDSAVVQFRIV